MVPASHSVRKRLLLFLMSSCFPCVFPEPVLISHRLFACVCMRVCTYMLWTGRGICRCESQASIETLIAEQNNERGSGEDGALLKLRYLMQTPSASEC